MIGAAPAIDVKWWPNKICRLVGTKSTASLNSWAGVKVSAWFRPNIFFSMKADFSATNVLEDPAIRVKLTEYSNWPTIPQLFVYGELIGGCDIVVELHQKGELTDILIQSEG